MLQSVLPLHLHTLHTRHLQALSLQNPWTQWSQSPPPLPIRSTSGATCQIPWVIRQFLSHTMTMIDPSQGSNLSLFQDPSKTIPRPGCACPIPTDSKLKFLHKMCYFSVILKILNNSWGSSCVFFESGSKSVESSAVPSFVSSCIFTWAFWWPWWWLEFFCQCQVKKGCSQERPVQEQASCLTNITNQQINHNQPPTVICQPVDCLEKQASPRNTFASNPRSLGGRRSWQRTPSEPSGVG